MAIFEESSPLGAKVSESFRGIGNFNVQGGRPPGAVWARR